MAARKKIYSCVIPKLTKAQAVVASVRALEESPANRPIITEIKGAEKFSLTPSRIAILTSKWWGAKRTELPTAFSENTSTELRNKLLKFMNRWSDRGTVRIKFVHSSTDPIIRVSRGAGGFWSYLGVDALGIPANEPTLNLESFTVKTPESEWLRVVPHEAGHALGAIHEHQRAEIVERLNAQAVIREFKRTQGWSAEEIRQQILTPEPESALTGSPHTEETSIMAYSFGGNLTKNGKPILGGSDITDMDYEYMAKIYPSSVEPPVEPLPVGGEQTEFTIRGRRYRVTEIV